MSITIKEFVEGLVRFDTSSANEWEAQQWVCDQFGSLGFETYTWEADAERLAAHDSFPEDPEAIPTANRPSIGGVLELGDPESGPTVVLNGHIDVVPVEFEHWETDPFEPTWRDGELIARGAADMKSGLAACVYAARTVAEDADDQLNGRIVVESVAGEEAGGIGAAAAALENPYPFDRDAAIVAEPTDRRLVTAVEGSVMLRLKLEGKSAHAATRWRGESVLPHFEAIHTRLCELEQERASRITHPLYERFEIPWPISVGRVEAGTWASSVAGSLTAEIRVGVAPGETVATVEQEVRDAVEEIRADDDWLRTHPPELERFSVQFEPAETPVNERIVEAVSAGMERCGLDDRSPYGVTYGADLRHYQAAGIPTVLFGPGTIEQAHFPNESIRWDDVRESRAVLAEAARSFLASGEQSQNCD
jgi:acetylornithine deacetylase